MIEKEDIINHEKQLLNAMESGNVETLARLLHSQMVFTNHEGRVLSKAQDLSVHISGQLRFQQFFLKEQSIRLFGDTAVVNLVLYLSGTYEGKFFNGRFRYSRVWQQTDGRLQVIAATSVLLPEEN
ncbi:MAG: nuclear transport factor 2 family protein [Bacteroidota bacterium]